MRYFFSGGLLVLVFFCALSVGRYHVGFGQILEILLNFDFSGREGYIVKTRLIRVVLAIFVGAGLSISGASFQSIFKNPLATPDILGVASGASFGAICAMMLNFNIYLTMIFGFIFGLLSLLLTIMVVKNANNHIMIILGGIVISALFSSLVSLLKYVADPQDTLPAITYWLLGSLSTNDMKGLITCVAAIIIGSAVILSFAWRHNHLMLEDDEAKALGINIVCLRLVLIVACTIIVAAIVSLCGIVGWIGIIIPHIARLICGSNMLKVLPLSLILGATFMIIIDTISRSATSAEIPISILSALFGAPIFIMILRKSKGVHL